MNPFFDYLWFAVKACTVLGASLAFAHWGPQAASQAPLPTPLPEVARLPILQERLSDSLPRHGQNAAFILAVALVLAVVIAVHGRSIWAFAARHIPRQLKPQQKEKKGLEEQEGQQQQQQQGEPVDKTTNHVVPGQQAQAAKTQRPPCRPQAMNHTRTSRLLRPCMPSRMMHGHSKPGPPRPLAKFFAVG